MQKNIENYLVRFTELNNWKILCSLILPFIILFFSTPSFKIIPEHWEPILIQSKDPFIQHNYPAHSHASKLAFRFIPALIIGFLHLKVLGVIIWQFLNGIFLFYVIGYVVEAKTRNKLTAFYSILLTALIFTGKVSFINFKDTFDSLILALLLLCFVFSNKLLIYIAILFISFTDERGLICSGFLFLYYLFFFSEKPNKTPYLITIITSWISYIIIRLSLSYFIGLTTSTGGFDFKTMALNLNFAPLSIWQIFEGAWILIFLFLRFQILNNLKSFFSVLLQLSIVIFVSFMVFDTSRSLVYVFPLFVIAIDVLNKQLEKQMLNTYLFYSVMISLIYPVYISAGNTNTWLTPLPIKLLFDFFTNS